MKRSIFLSAMTIAVASATAIADNTVVLQADKPGARVQPTMYGIFFEDINYAADGGLYAEMVKNRSFEFPYALTGWTPFGTIEVKEKGGPFERNPHYVRLMPSGHNDKHSGLENQGFFGVTFKKDSVYKFSVYMRAPEGAGKVRVELCNPASMDNSMVYASHTFEVTSPDWTKYSADLKPTKGCDKGVLRLFLVHPDKPIDVEHVSMFPANTWKGREGGLRQDLAQALADLKPGIFRFPGGCIVEGTEVPDRYQWKNTVGPVENRPTNLNRWLYTFPNRLASDYYQSGGLGFYEYFQLSEDIGAEPLPVLNVGLVCQYQNWHQDQTIPLDSLQPYIDDALDLIEFANGGTDTKWGKLRADMGHPAPFNLKYLAIGNEQWGPEYVARLEPFLKVLKEKHPEIKIIGSSGPDSEGDKFDYLWPEMRRLKADLVDEHFYRPGEWFLSQGTRYDKYPRKGTKVFAGEYACHIKGKKYNHFYPALLEGAFMTGLERNADVVEMATYAPLFAHVEGWQWRPDMIWFDNTRSMKTASYYVQQMYSLNRGDRVLPLTMDKKPVAGLEGQNGLFASAVSEGNDIIVKVANTGETAQPFTIDFKGIKAKAPLTGLTMTRLTAPDEAENTLDNPDTVKPVTTKGSVNVTTNWSTTLPARSMTVYRFSR
jgi:alpha-N-arabinofuranosidase